MSPSTTGRCYQTREWRQPTNESVAWRHGSQSQLYQFFCVVDRTLTHFFLSTGPEVISKFPSHSSLAALLSHQPGSGLNCEIVELRDERRDGRGPAPAPAPATLSCSGNRELGNNIRHRNPRPRQTTKMIP